MRTSALRAQLVSALLEFAWDEWAQMGVLAPAPPARRWAQDPEALVLLTLEVGRDDPRLFDEVLDWLVRNEPLVSVRRLRALCDGSEDERLVAAATEWVMLQRRPRTRTPGQEGKDERRGAAAEPLFRDADLPAFRTDPVFADFGFTRPPVEPTGKSREPDLAAPINFAFRLRHLLGVGTRAEAVRYLLTTDVESATVAEVAASSGYAKRNIHEALASLQSAGVATLAKSGGEQRFAVDRARWAYLMGLETAELPVYRDWPMLLGALRRILRWLMRPDLAGLSEYLLASQAADLLDGVRPALNRAGVLFPARLGEERSWTDLEDTVEYALRWLAPQRVPARPAAFEIVQDASRRYRWRLTTATGRIVAISAETYGSLRAARAAADRLRRAPERFSFTPTQDAGAYRWHVVAENGRILAVSSESFAMSRDAERAARDTRDLIAGAAPPSETHETLNRVRRHITLRPDGRWQVQAEGATRAASTHATQAQAVKAARQQAHNDPGGGVVVVHGRDGRIRSSDLIPAG
jgi:uncharacterized protein YegP (UPF0339 family)